MCWLPGRVGGAQRRERGRVMPTSACFLGYPIHFLLILSRETVHAVPVTDGNDKTEKERGEGIVLMF